MNKKIVVLVLLLFTFFVSSVAQAQSTAFTYHGYLTDSAGQPVTGRCLFRFRLFDALTGGTQIGHSIQDSPNVQDGNFSVQLNFGINVYDGVQRYLEIAVQCRGDRSFVTLTPRFPLTPYPNIIYPWYALVGVPAGFADNIDDVNDADSDAANEFNTSLALIGTTLHLGDAGGTLSVDLSSLGGGAGSTNWSDLTNVPAGFADGDDAVGITSELDPVWAGVSGNYYTNTNLQTSGEAPVHWGNLSNVPADLADGDAVDDADSNPNNEVNSGLVLNGTSLELTDAGGTLSADLSSLIGVASTDWSDLTNIPGDFADNVDNVISDWTALTNIPAGFADGTDDVGDDWNSLSNVPAGFADGVDDVSGDWNALTNIPADFADGTDNVGDDWNNLSNVPAGFADNTDDLGDNWDMLTNVPADFADGIDNVGDDWDTLSNVPAGFADNTDNTGNDWSLGGNGGTTPGTDFIGTTDNAALEFHVNSERGLRIEPADDGTFSGNNVIGGNSGNTVAADVVGATVFGGGDAYPNNVAGDFGTVSGGLLNITSGDYSTVGGGVGNEASGDGSTVSGGYTNTAAGFFGTVSGGGSNEASGDNSTVGGGQLNNAGGTSSTVSGGNNNRVYDNYGTIGGGGGNIAGTDDGDTTIQTFATIGGGQNNIASGFLGTVGGGGSNEASGDSSTVSGGTMNEASGYISTVGGGVSNIAAGGASTVSGGNGNNAGNVNSTVGGGYQNSASGDASMVGGGVSNEATSDSSVVSGGWLNQVLAAYGTIGGGAPSDTNNPTTTNNRVYDDYGTIGGGGGNVVGLHDGNTVTQTYATIGGGQNNIASGWRSTVGGGFNNAATNQNSTVGGGNSNTATSGGSTVGGGNNNNATAGGSTVGGGNNNNATNVNTTVSGGFFNTASGPYSTVGGGWNNTAAGDYSFVVGRQAKNNDPTHSGVFLFSDNSSSGNFFSAAANEFAARVSGGVRLRTSSDLSTGCNLAGGSGTWSCTSSREAKNDFSMVDTRAVLERVAAMPVTTWRYNTTDTLHMGPVAEDFYAAFGLGEGNTTISTVDADGVALAAIQGLYEVVQDKDARIAELEARLGDLERQDHTALYALMVLIVGAAGLYVGQRRKGTA